VVPHFVSPSELKIESLPIPLRNENLLL
jgi:hypothetical protein